MNWRKLIKDQMEARGVTQEKLAVKLDMTQGGLGHWLNGKRQPPFEKLIEIADILKLDRAQLGAAIMEADSIQRSESLPVLTQQASAESQLTAPVNVDLDLLQQILDPHSGIREQFADFLVQVRTKDAPTAATSKKGKAVKNGR